MRKRTVFQTLLLAALLTGLFTTCSDESVLNPSDRPLSDEESSLTFTLPGVKKAVRSYSVAGTDLENQIDSLDIYMFTDSTHLLTKVFRPRNSALAMTGNELTATIDITGRKGDHTFYFVANSKDNASELEDVFVGITAEYDFLERLTDINAGLVEAPFLMTAQHKVPAIESADKSTGTSVNKVKLSRRVARFDVDNDTSVTNFTIDKILVENVYRQAYAFGDATATPAQTLERGNLPEINYSDSTDANGSTPLYGLFYLYPTKIEEGETEISFEGEFLNQRRIYTLKTSKTIDANKRYMLKVKPIDIVNPDLEITIEDWDDVSDLYEAEPETNDVIFSGITIAPANTGVTETEAPTTTGIVTEATYDITNIKGQTTLSFTVESYYAKGSYAVITGNKDDLPGFDVIDEPAKLTYGARYVQPYKIIIPERADERKEIDILVEVVNQANPQQRLNITIHGDTILDPYPGTNLLPVKVGGVYWAPVNVGATEIGTTNTVKHMGNLFQWGRNVPFVHGGDPGDIYGTAGPVSIAIATGAAMDKFIKGTSTGNYDWLSPPQNELWSGDNRQGPCPEGWRVPTKVDLEKIFALFQTNYASSGRLSLADGHLTVTGDNGTDILFLPAAGYRNDSSGTSYGYGSYGFYWSSYPDLARAARWYFNSSKLLMDTGSRAVASSVRCVKD